MQLDRRIALFVTLTGAFVTCLVVGDIIGNKLTQATVYGKAYVISAGMIPFPVTFLRTDLLPEFYGKQAARFVTLVGFACATFTIAVLSVAVQLPWADLTTGADWQGVTKATFDNVFAGSQRILFASLVAYMVAQFTDIAVFHALKRLTRNKLLWARATGSTLISQLIDTGIVQMIAWVGLLPLAEIFGIAVNSYIVKVVIAVSLTPLIYIGHGLLEQVMGIEPVVLDDDGNPIGAR